MEETPLWLDCDPGHDDAFAILLAAYHPALNLLGISTVHGNVSLEQTTVNALSILKAVGKPKIPVYAGAAKPFCRKVVHAPNIHGSTGIDGSELLPKDDLPDRKATNAIVAAYAALMSQPNGKTWIVATAALTNVALLFAIYPDLVDHIKGLSIMGGAIGGGFSNAPMGHVKGEGERIGNKTPWAEFNIYCDPEAARAIFSNPVLAAKTTLIPLDLTHQVLATGEVQQMLLHGSSLSLRKPNSLNAEAKSLRPMLHGLLTFYASTYANVFGMTSGPPLHDPVAVAVVLLDQLNEDLKFDDRGGERWHVNIVTDGPHTDKENDRGGQVGRTVARKAERHEAGVRIPRSLNVERFWYMIDGCIQLAESYFLNRVRTKVSESLI